MHTLHFNAGDDVYSLATAFTISKKRKKKKITFKVIEEEKKWMKFHSPKQKEDRDGLFQFYSHETLNSWSCEPIEKGWVGLWSFWSVKKTKVEILRFFSLSSYSLEQILGIFGGVFSFSLLWFSVTIKVLRWDKLEAKNAQSCVPSLPISPCLRSTKP